MIRFAKYVLGTFCMSVHLAQVSGLVTLKETASPLPYLSHLCRQGFFVSLLATLYSVQTLLGSQNYSLQIIQKLISILSLCSHDIPNVYTYWPVAVYTLRVNWRENSQTKPIQPNEKYD